MDDLSITNEHILNTTIGFYVVSVIVFALRLLTVRWCSKRMGWDDMLMCFIFAVYTISMGLTNASYRYPTNLALPGQPVVDLLDQKEVHDRIIGSVLVIFVEQSLLITIWGIKYCILVFMYPISDKLHGARIILKFTGAYIITSYVIIQILYLGVLCVPFRQYWAIVVTNQQCATYTTYYEVHLALNSTAYIFIMVTTIVVAASWQLPTSRRMIVASLLCLGVFTMTAALLSKYYKFTRQGDPTYALWYIIESSLGMWTASIICCWPLIQKCLHYPSFQYEWSFYVVRDPIPSSDIPQAGQSRSSPWWSTLLSHVKRQRVRGTVEEDIEMDVPSLPAIPAARHAASASVGTTILMHTELMAYLENESLTPHSHGLHRDNDTSPALDYRDINKID